MPSPSSLESIRARMFDAEASSTGQRALAARLHREVVELEALRLRDATRLREARTPSGNAEDRARIEALQARCEALATRLSDVTAAATWLQARCTRLEASRPVRWGRRLRSWLGRSDGSMASAGIAADTALLRASGRVDEAWYLATYPDVAAAGVDPVEHYLAFGANEGREPAPDFDSAAYAAAHPELQATGMNPLLHALLRDALAQSGTP